MLRSQNWKIINNFIFTPKIVILLGTRALNGSTRLPALRFEVPIGSISLVLIVFDRIEPILMFQTMWGKSSFQYAFVVVHCPILPTDFQYVICYHRLFPNQRAFCILNPQNCIIARFYQGFVTRVMQTNVILCSRTAINSLIRTSMLLVSSTHLVHSIGRFRDQNVIGGFFCEFSPKLE